MNDRHDPSPIDALLERAFDSRRQAVGARPSLGDVRRRARRRQRRSVGGITVAAAVVGVGGVAAIATRTPTDSAAVGSPDGSVDCWDTSAPSWATTTSFVFPGNVATTWQPGSEATSTTDGVGEPAWAGEPTTSDIVDQGLEPGASTSLFPPTSTTVVEAGATDPQVTVSTVEWAGDGMVLDTGPFVEGTTPCVPAGAVATTSVVEGDYSVTTVAYFVNSVLVVDASGDPTSSALDEVLARLGGAPVEVVAATRSVEQTMVMPTGDGVELASTVAGWLGVGGFDTLDRSLAPDGSIADAVEVVVIIGRDRATTEGHDQSTTTSIEQTTP